MARICALLNSLIMTVLAAPNGTMPPMTPQLIIFDFDGVLCDAGTFTPAAIRLGLQRFGALVGLPIADPGDETLLQTLGYPSRQTYPPLLPEPVRDRWQEMHRLTLDAMEERIRALGPACLYPGVPQLLDALLADGRTLALASNSSARYQRVHAEVHGLDRWFSRLYHAELEGIDTKADMVGAILAAEPARPAVFVGDRASDQLAAAAHGLPFIACAYGYGTPGEWGEPVAVARHIAELGLALGLPAPPVCGAVGES
jgi:phosphoglycolate phosphatase